MEWSDLEFFQSEEFQRVKTFLAEQGEYLPHKRKVFRAFQLTPFEETKVVILGQDPYPTPGHANGLAFSVSPNVKSFPPSLRNIFKELVDDIGCDMPTRGSLVPWAMQGVLLLNTSLTVVPKQANSHKGLWDNLIHEAIRELTERSPDVIFILWGKNAQNASPVLDWYKHKILAPHPSPYSASSGFFGSKPFSKANRMLEEFRKEPIDWSL